MLTSTEKEWKNKLLSDCVAFPIDWLARQNHCTSHLLGASVGGISLSNRGTESEFVNRVRSRIFNSTKQSWGGLIRRVARQLGRFWNEVSLRTLRFSRRGGMHRDATNVSPMVVLWPSVKVLFSVFVAPYVGLLTFFSQFSFMLHNLHISCNTFAYTI